MDKESENSKSEMNLLSESCWKAIPSTNFMKILLVNIIESIFVLTNICIGIFLINRHDYSERAFIYALGLLILPFMINLLITLNESFYKTELAKSNGKYDLMKIIVLLFLLQHLSFLLFIMTMCGIKFHENYTRRLTKVNLRRSIIYSSINNNVLLFLILRGVITWDNRTCLVDDLGRSACIIYPVIITIVIGMSITVIYLHKMQNLESYLFPISLTVIIYRTISFSLIISYLDFWSIIPIVLIFLCGMIFTTKSKNIDTIKERDELDGATGLVWDGDEWIGLQTSIDLNFTKTVITNKTCYNEEMSPLMSSIIHIFCVFNNKTKLFTLIDLLIITVLIVIVYLVNISLNFNYEYNILDNSSFCLLCSMLSLFGFINIVITIYVERYLKSLCSNVIVIISCLVITSCIPLSLILNKHLSPISKVYFFSITNTSNISYVSVLEEDVDAFSENSDLIQSFQIYQIKINPNYLTKKKSLIFCDELRYCSQENDNLNFVISNADNNIRSSSPKIFPHKNMFYLHKDFKLENVARMANNSNLLYVSQNPPNPNILSTLISCSNEKSINIDRSHNDYCDLTYLESGKVYQIKCILMGDQNFKVKVECKSLNLDFQLISNNSVMPKFNFTFSNGLKNSLCCLNDSHSLSFYGNCNIDKSLNSGKTYPSLYLKANSCFKQSLLQYWSFLNQTQICIVQFSYFSSCYYPKVFNICESHLFPCSDHMNI